MPTILMTRDMFGANATLYAKGGSYEVNLETAQRFFGDNAATLIEPTVENLMPDSMMMTLQAANAVQAAFNAGSGRGIGGGLPVGKSQLLRWRKALGDMMAGVADARLQLIGDSTTAGLLVNNTGKWALSPSAQLARLLAARGIPVNANHAFGDQTRTGGSTFTNFDGRFTLGTNWTSAAAAQAHMAGSPLQNTAGSGTLSFTPTDPVTGAAYVFDTFDVYYVQNTAYGSFQLAVDGGAAIGATVVCAGARSLQVATRSTTLAGHTININATAAGQIFICGIVCRVAGQARLMIFNQGGGSYTTTQYAMGTVGDFTPTAALSNNALSAPLAPHLAIVDLSINDRRIAAYTSAFDTSLNSLLDRLETVGSDVVLCKPVPSSNTATAFSTLANQQAFDAAIERIAAARGLLLFDKRARLGTYEEANAAGFFSDALHPSQGAYCTQALDLLPYVLPA